MSNPNLPLVDLHRHLDGNIRISTILELSQQHNLPLPTSDINALSELVLIQDKTSDLLAFLEKLDYGVSVLADLEACERIAYENVEDAYNEGLAYVELRFSPFYMAQSHNLSIADVVASVIKGVKAARQRYPVKVSLIGILSRSFGEQRCMDELFGLITHHEHIAGLDLAGDEFNYPAKRFEKHFAIARERTNWRYTIHAGEADGPSSIWDAINILHAERIGHGVRAIEDEKLMRYLKEHDIGIESCITSNYQTGTWTDSASHPVQNFLEHGIKVCLNTDDPGISNITLEDEFRVAKSIVQLSDADCLRLQRNAIEMAFLSSKEKTALLEGSD